jgi:exodeoxyribonuclease III
MKLVTWNCQGAYRKKAKILLQQQPDIVVVQECEHPDKLVFEDNTQYPNDSLWFGDYLHKGLGIFSYSEYKFAIHKSYNADFKFVIPITVSGGEVEFILFAIWANNPSDKNGRYVEQVWKAIHHYDSLLYDFPCILTGDFNSNTIWDRKSRIGNHSEVVEKLKEKKIVSIYHLYLKEEQGKEKTPTFYLYRNVEKPYHLDYCFVSQYFYDKLQELEVGKFENWIGFSDHLPLFISFKPLI